MVKQFVLVLVFSLVYSTFGLDTNYSPVLFFKSKLNGNSYPKSVISSTTPMEQREFERIVGALDANQRIVFLVTDDLSPEDLSIRNEHNRHGFQNLATGLDIVDYIPYVQNAVDNKITMGKNVERTTLMSNNEITPKPNDSARIIMVKLPECDETESRYHCMARIDRACYALSTSSEFKDALFVLSSEMNSHLHEVHSRRTRDTGEATTAKPPIDPTAHLYKRPNSLLYFKDMMERSKDAKGKVTDAVIEVPDVTTTKIDEHNITLQFQGKYPMLWHFNYDEEMAYWSLDGEKSRFYNLPIDTWQIDISAPFNFSYSCNASSSLYFQLPNRTKEDVAQGIWFVDLQLELNFTNPADGPVLEKFNESYDCVYFTTAPIWAALFVTFLLLAIVSTALTYIMDIKTMDRFDDPKGKTITINASE